MSNRNKSADETLETARQLAKTGNIPAAAQMLQAALASSPKNKKIKNALRALQKQVIAQNLDGNLKVDMAKLMQLYSAGKMDHALTQAKHLCHLYPDQPVPFNVMGVIHAGRYEYTSAVDCYEKALAIAPQFVDAINNLGSALHKLQRPEEAVQRFAQVIKLQPRDADAYYNLGNVLLSNDQPEEAIVHFQQAIEFRPLYPPAHYQLGNALRLSGEENHAITSYRNAISMSPKLIDAHINIGEILYNQKDYASAIECFLDALDIQPDHPGIRRKLGLSQLNIGARDEAIASFQAYLAMDPNSLDARELLTEAENLPIG